MGLSGDGGGGQYYSLLGEDWPTGTCWLGRTGGEGTMVVTLCLMECPISECWTDLPVMVKRDKL